MSKVILKKAAHVYALPGEIIVNDAEAKRLYSLGIASPAIAIVEEKPKRNYRKKKEEDKAEE